jgi:hypothetical protein
MAARGESPMRWLAFGSGWPGSVSRFGLLILLPLVVGCGPGQGRVSGRVLYNGQPLPGGRLTFLPADPTRNSVGAELDEQGNYEAVLPAGEVKVSVDNRELEPRGPKDAGLPKDINLPSDIKKLLASAKADKAPPPSPAQAADKPAGRYVPIPAKYYLAETSGLTFTVKSGSQQHDIELPR